MEAAAVSERPGSSRSRYRPPEKFDRISLNAALKYSERFNSQSVGETADMFDATRVAGEREQDLTLNYVGNLQLLRRRCVSIVGTREVSEEGTRRARKLAVGLVRAGVVVVSGLALGVDTAAHTGALEAGGSTIAVIGTPLDRCNPPRNAQLQELIYREHLLISQFEWGSPVYPHNFPQRNKVMATLSDATVIIEASDTSGTLHQAVECVKLKRPLFIARSVVENRSLAWPPRFLKHSTVFVLDAVEDVLSRMGSS